MINAELLDSPVLSRLDQPCRDAERALEGLEDAAVGICRVNQNWPTVYPLKTHGADAADGANARSARRSVFSGIR
jgi:hypothetical protein